MPPRQSERARFRDELIKSYGDRVAPRHDTPAARQVMSTGVLGIDYALRIGGLQRGRVHEIVGPPDCAKTTVVINAMAWALRKYPLQDVGYVDIEGTFDDEWAGLNGLDLGRVEHLYADDSEDCSDMARGLVRSGLHSLVVVDSIGGMESRKALEKIAVDTLPGRNAQVITRMCKHLATLTRQKECTVILVNQLRAQIGTLGADVSAGPKEMQHATTSRIMMGKGGAEPIRMVFEEGQPAEDVAVQFKARVTRMKSGATGRVAEFWVNKQGTPEHGPPGVNAMDDYLSVGVRLGAIERDGAGNYTLPGTGKVKGRTAAAQLLRDRPELCAAIRERIFSPEGQPR